jgi:hypothetical protein
LGNLTPSTRQEVEMKRVSILAAIGLMSIASPAIAHHADHLDIPYDSRGECEASIATLRNEDRDFLQQIGPQYFSDAGDVESFLSRAFTCELSDADGQWYITDHRIEVLTSDWFLKRSR